MQITIDAYTGTPGDFNRYDTERLHRVITRLWIGDKEIGLWSWNNWRRTTVAAYPMGT